MPSTPVEYLFSGTILILAGYVRGYGGFGFSMISVAGLALLFSPAMIVPAILLLEIVASSYLLAGVWRKVNWMALMWLSGGMLLGTPAGVWLLGYLPGHLLKMAIAIVVAVLAGLLRSGFRPQRPMGRGGTLATGALSGVFNGSAAVGGPPVVLFFFSSPAGVDISRASLIAYFLGTDIIAAGTCIGMGLMTGDSLRLFLMALIPMGIGLTAGKRTFFQTDQEVFRKRVMLYLMILSGVLLIKTMWSIYQG